MRDSPRFEWLIAVTKTGGWRVLAKLKCWKSAAVTATSFGTLSQAHATPCGTVSWYFSTGLDRLADARYKAESFSPVPSATNSADSRKKLNVTLRLAAMLRIAGIAVAMQCSLEESNALLAEAQISKANDSLGPMHNQPTDHPQTTSSPPLSPLVRPLSAATWPPRPDRPH